MAIPVWEQKAKEKLKAFIKKNQKTLATLEERDAVEEDTRTFVTDMLVDGFGFDKYEDLTSEKRIQHEFADIAIRLERDIRAIIEVKRIKLNLKEQHLRQVKSYAANSDVRWAILTNGRHWQIYRISDTTPITDHLLFSVDLLDSTTLAEKVEKLWMLCRESMKRDLLLNEWKTVSALSVEKVKASLLGEPVLRALRAQIRAETQEFVDIQKLREAVEEILK